MKLPFNKRSHSRIKNFKYGEISFVTGLILFYVQVSLSQGATVTNDAMSRRTSSKYHEVGLGDQNTNRDPRILKDLSKLNRQGCLAKVLCGVDVARPPSDRTSTLNDYAYMVKSFFDIFSFSGLLETLAERDDLSRSSLKNKKKGNKKKKQDNVRDDEEYDYESYEPKMTLEELLSEKLKKRRGRIFDEPRNGSEIHPRKNSQGITNPRFNKTMYLDRKQREFNMAANEEEKLKIADEVGKKFRSARQCRSMGFLNTNFSFCPFAATDLQNMLLNSTGSLLSPTTTTTLKPITLEELALLYGDDYAYRGFQDTEYKEQIYNGPGLVEVEEGWPSLPDYDSTIAKETAPTEDESLMIGRARYSVIKRRTTTTEKPKIVYFKQRRKNTSAQNRRSPSNSEEEEEEENDNSDEDTEEPQNKPNVAEESEEEEENSDTKTRRISNSNENKSQEDVEDESEEDNDEEENGSESEEQQTNLQEKAVQIPKPTRQAKVKYSVLNEAMNFKPPKIDRDYSLVSNTFARPDDEIITYDRFLTGEPAIWNPNEETWTTPEKHETPKQNIRKFIAPKFKKEKESESSEEEDETEKNEDETTEDKEDNDNVPAIQSTPRYFPRLPQVRFRAVKFRGKRSYPNQNLKLHKKKVDNSLVRELAKEIFVDKFKYIPLM